MKTNKVYLVGAGPAGADLITVRALEILRQADVVIYDYLVDKELLKETKEGAELICCDKLGKQRYADGFLLHQEKISQLLVKKAQQGKKVVRLKNGDPTILSRLTQELNALVKKSIDFEIVPGVTAASAAASFSGIPLTDRGYASSVVFLTGHQTQDKKETAINYKGVASCGTIVLYMAVENISVIAKNLIAAGKPPDTPVACISFVGQINQKTVSARLNNIAKIVKEKNIWPPAIFIIGKVVQFERKFNWLRKNKRILFTGLSSQRFFLKSNYFHLPLIKLEPLSDYAEFDAYLKNIRAFNWIVFSSRYGAEYFFNRLSYLGLDARWLSGINIAAIGSSTAKRLADFGLIADLIPNEESSRGLLRTFKAFDLENKKIFLPRSDIADKGLTKGLVDLKANVVSSIAYRNVRPKDLPALELESFDEIMFTSPSGVRNFLKRYGRPPRAVKLSFIGEVTAAEAKKWHLSG